MTKIKHTALFLFLSWTIVASSAASAQYFMSGNKLYEHCARSNSNFLAGFVIGVVEKAYKDRDVVMHYRRMSEIDLTPLTATAEFNATVLGTIGVFCVPVSATVKQLSDLVCKYLHDNPAERSQSGASLVVRSIQDGFAHPDACKQ